METDNVSGTGSFLGTLWNPFLFSRQPLVRLLIDECFSVTIDFVLHQFFMLCSSGPMTGFYLYFAITKREFSLGSWRERIIEVMPVCLRRHRTSNNAALAGEKEATL
jgi:hypothetical protein